MALRSWLARGILLAGAYYILGRLALLLAIPPGYATAVWPAAGVGLAGLLMFGNRFWPAIALASFLINLPTGLHTQVGTSLVRPILLAAALASGVALQALVGATLVRRWVGYPLNLHRERAIGALLAVGGPVACVVSASIGITSLWAAGVLPTSIVAFSWWTWWVGDTIGVLLFMPLLLAWTGTRDPLARREKLFVTIPVCVVLALVIGVFIQASALEQRRIRTESERKAQIATQDLASTLHGYVEAVRAVASFETATPDANRAAFHAFCAGLLPHRSGLLALTWNPRVTRAQRAEHEQAIRRQGFPAYQIRELAADGRLVRASPKSEYFPITIFEPVAPNIRAMGLDVASDITRRRALTKSRVTAAPVATSEIDLVQAVRDRSGIIIYMPVYAPDAGGPGIRELRGYAAAAFRLSDVMAAFLRKADIDGMHVRMQEGMGPDASPVLYPADGDPVTAAGSKATHETLVYSNYVDVAGHRWTVEFLSDAQAAGVQGSWLAWGVLAAGMLFAAMFSLFLLFSVARRLSVESEVRDRTGELQASNRALKDSQERTRSIIDTALDAYLSIDARSRVLEWNLQAEQMFGWSREEVLHRDLAQLLLPQRAAQAHRDQMQHLLTDGPASFAGKRMVLAALHRQGHEIPVEVSFWSTLSAGEWRLHVFLHDISAKQRAARRLAAQTSAAAALLKSENIEEAAPRLLHAIGSELGWSVGALWIVDANEGLLRCIDVWQADPQATSKFADDTRGRTFQRGVGLPGGAWGDAAPQWIPDVLQEKNFPRALLAGHADLHGAFAVPLVNGDEVVAVLEFFSTGVQPMDAELLAMMNTLAGLVGQFIARTRAEHALEREGAFLAALLENITEGIVACDQDGILSVFNRATRELHGLPEEHLAPELWAEHYDLYLADGTTRMGKDQIPLFRALSGEQVRDVEMVIAPKDRPRRVVVCNGRALFERNGEKSGAVVAMHDITQRKQSELSLQQLAHFDQLTGLPNRRLFQESLDGAIRQADSQQSVVFLMFLDLDNFKDVNDTLGHAVGDGLLREVGQRLLRSVRMRDSVSRMGGDEFGVILVAPDDPEIAARIATKIIESLAAPFEIEGHTLSTSASIGITAYPLDTADAHGMVRFADLAMYEAKHSGKNSYRFYTEAMNQRVQERITLEAALRLALENEEFLLHYQPKFELQTGRWAGVEALLRWQRPGHGLVQPSDFIPALEQTGLIVQVGSWVLNHACAQLATWERQGFGPLPIAVNVSAHQMTTRTSPVRTAQAGDAVALEASMDLWTNASTCLQKHAFQAGQLEFEVTESTVMSDVEDSAEVLGRLKALGIRISVDDFGTGYSSLAYLRRFPLDTVKIDRSFIRDMTTNADDQAIALAIIGMAHRLNLKVVAEGVETAEQLDFLRTQGCDQAQGFHLARPMPLQALEALWNQTGGVFPGLA